MRNQAQVAGKTPHLYPLPFQGERRDTPVDRIAQSQTIEGPSLLIVQQKSINCSVRCPQRIVFEPHAGRIR